MLKKFVCLLTIIFLVCIIPSVSATTVEETTYNNFDGSAVYSCGDGMVENIPTSLPKVIHIVYNVIQIAVPIILVIFGMLDLFKGIMAQKDDEIKKGQKVFIKRLIVAAIIFFVFGIVKFVVSLIGDDTEGIIDCMDCFINEECGSDI